MRHGREMGADTWARGYIAGWRGQMKFETDSNEFK
jgi:hypothetical protein